MTISGAALTGMAVARGMLEQVAQRLSRSAATEPGQAGAVVLSEEMVRLLVAKRSFQTAVKLAQTAAEIEKRTLDLLG